MRKSTVASRRCGDHSGFCTEVATRRKLEEKGCVLVDTTCGDVMSV